MSSSYPGVLFYYSIIIISFFNMMWLLQNVKRKNRLWVVGVVSGHHLHCNFHSYDIAVCHYSKVVTNAIILMLENCLHFILFIPKSATYCCCLEPFSQLSDKQYILAPVCTLTIGRYQKTNNIAHLCYYAFFFQFFPMTGLIFIIQV